MRLGKCGLDLMTEDRSKLPFGRKISILFLAFAGASIDAASYLALGRVFTANMTGNTIVFVLSLAEGDTGGMLRAGIALFGFIAGAAAGEIIFLRTLSSGLCISTIKKPYTIPAALLFEVLDLLAILFWWRLDGLHPAAKTLYALIALSALAMGLQSIAVGHLHAGNVATTYITGTVTGLAGSFVDWLRGMTNAGRSERPGLHQEVSTHGPAFPAADWLIYAVGAVAGGLGAIQWHFLVLLLPVIAISIAAILLMFEKRTELNGGGGG